MEKSTKKRIATGATAVALALMMVGGSYAYLTSSTNDMVNNFNANYVQVDLSESTGTEYEIVPGSVQSKDPVVEVETTVPAFVFLEAKNNTDGLVNYEIDEAWTVLDGHENIYYREVDGSDTKYNLNVLKNNQVSCPSSITNEDMVIENTDGSYTLKEGITLAFNAQAIQKDGFENVSQAFEALTNPTI